MSHAHPILAESERSTFTEVRPRSERPTVPGGSLAALEAIDEDHGLLTDVPDQAGHSDVDGGPLSAVPASITTANGGSVSLVADGSFTYTPDAGFSGSDSFTYTVFDQDGDSDTATVLRAPDALTAASLAAWASKWSGASTKA